MKNYSVAIIGGGASGLMCCALLVNYNSNNPVNLKIALFERNERLGKKLSSTGNGQGNVSNTDMSLKHYFSDTPERAARVLKCYDREKVLGFLTSLGGLFLPDEKGRIYPASKQASSVTDLFRSYIDGKADVYTGRMVTSLEHSGGKFIISAGGERYSADRVILCGGGKAQKNFGSDGNAYLLAEGFGHTVTPLYPSLVQLKTDTSDIKGLRGIRADVRLKGVTKKGVSVSVGDIIFTDYGISGNAAFYLSPHLSGESEGKIYIEFLPSVGSEELKSIISEKLKTFKGEREELLGCILNNQLGRCVMRRCRGKTAEGIVREIKNFSLEYRGTLGFDYAQVTKGGIPLSEVSDSLESLKRRNLYLCGELLNVDGECGGYNLQWAFSSAFAACCDIIKKSGVA